MRRQRHLRGPYAIAALILLAIEVMIALFVRDTFVRGYLGDVLAVMLVYAVLRTVTPLGVIAAVLVSLGIAFAIEIAQALDILGALGVRDNTLARVVFGGQFDWLDIAAYLAGGLVVFTVELMLPGRRNA